MLNNELSEISWLGLSFLVGQGSNLHVRVELVLVLVNLECFDVLLEGLDALVNLRLQALVLLVNPGVLVDKHSLVIAVGGVGHRGGFEGDLELHLLVGLEQMGHQFLL